MSGKVVRPEGFEKAILEALSEYGEKIFETTDKITKSTARQTSSALKSSSAGGKFARGWSHRALKPGAWGVGQVVYNREYQLIHLQEKPHKTGTGSYASYYPKHVDYTGRIAAVEEEYTNKYMEEVMSKL